VLTGSVLDLRGRHFLVTGAASGIGYAISVLFAQLGAKVSLVDKNRAALAAISYPTTLHGGVSHVFDLADIDGIDTLVGNVVEANGPLDGIVHAAGIQTAVPARDMTSRIWRSILAVNCEAALALSRLISKRRVHAGNGGAIIFISSVMAEAGEAGSTAYSMSKAALHGLARSLAIELAAKAIRVNCIAPGYVRTPMFERLRKSWDDDQRDKVEALHPLGIGEPADVANAAAFLAADTGRWITGTTLVVDGGYLAR
jgi:NAD(P)-dependent dehydrogenase (short-subunit alcohol dehydrogenase family)